MKKTNPVGTILAVFLTIGLFILEGCAFLYFNFDHILSKNYIKNVVTKIETKDLLTDENGKENELYLQLIDKASKYEISHTTVEKLIETNAFKEIQSTILSEYIDYFIHRNMEKDKINQEINKIIEQNIDEIANIFDEEMTEEKKEKIKNQIKSLTTEYNNYLNTEQIEQITEVSPIPRLFNPTVKTILITGIILCTILIAISTLSFYKWTIYTGIATLISGFFTFAFSFLIDIIIEALIRSNDTALLQFQTILEPIKNPFLITGIISFTIGIILIIIYNIINQIKKTNQNILINE